MGVQRIPPPHAGRPKGERWLTRAAPRPPQISLPLRASREGAGRSNGPASKQKNSELVWWPNCPEPETSYKIAKLMADLYNDAENKVDKLASERMALIVHYRTRNFEMVDESSSDEL